MLAEDLHSGAEPAESIHNIRHGPDDHQILATPFRYPIISEAIQNVSGAPLNQSLQNLSDGKGDVMKVARVRPISSSFIHLTTRMCSSGWSPLLLF